MSGFAVSRFRGHGALMYHRGGADILRFALLGFRYVDISRVWACGFDVRNFEIYCDFGAPGPAASTFRDFEVYGFRDFVNSRIL